MSLAVAIYHVPFSVGVAVSTRLGNLIGSGSLSSARTATRTYIFTFLLIGVFDFAFLTAARNVLPKAFSTDPEVISIVSTVLPLLAVFQFCDSTTALANAILRGLGLQAIGVLCYCGSACAVFVLQVGLETRGTLGRVCGGEQLYHGCGGGVYVFL
jgi:MATE family multidrug resistance protein